ncbi:MAG TPA: DUF2269 domain-containing protein [Candidatus Limnocylindria bacterium]|nr:DUF2269 domain-containing protein [Candidatus Limnocylindria bacterium]
MLVFVALAGLGLASDDERVVRGAYLVMAPAAWFVLVPLAHGALLSGLVLSLGTAWGLFRHYWVASKLVITAVSTGVLLVYMGTFRQMAGVAADPVVELGAVRNPSPLVHAVVAFFLLLAATVLAIYKPFGATPYGARTLGHQGASASSLEPSGIPWTSASLYLAAAAGLVGILLLVLHHLSGSQFHH